MLRRFFASRSAGGKKPNYRTINAQLLAATNASQLQAIILLTGKMDAINCATAFRCLAKHNKSIDGKDDSALAMDKLLQLTNANTLLPGKSLSIACHSIANGQLLRKIPRELLTKLEAFDFTKFDPQAVGNILWAFGKLGQSDSFVLDSFANVIATRDLSDYQVQNLANAIWAFATLGYHHAAACQAISNEVLRRNLAGFSFQDLSTLLWAFATLNDASLCDAFVVELTKRNRLGDFPPQAISNICWALASLNYNNNNCEHLFAGVAKLNFAAFTPQHLATVLWANSTMTRNKDLTLALVDAVNKHRQLYGDLSRFSPQDLSTMVWSLSSLNSRGSKDLEFGQMLLSEISTARDLRQFNEKDVSNLMLGVIALDFPRNARLLNRIATECDFATFSPLALTNTLRAFACFDFKHCDRLVQEVMRRGDFYSAGFSPQSIATVFWSCAVMEFHHVDICHNMQTATTPLALSRFTLQDLSNIVWSMAVLDHGEQVDLANVLALELCNRRDFTLQGLVNAMWGFACMDLLQEPQIQRFFETAQVWPSNKNTHALLMRDATLKDAQQLLHTRLAWEQSNGSQSSIVLDSLCGNGEWIVEKIAHADDARELSQVHFSISQILKRFFPSDDFQVETRLSNGIFVDMLVPSKQVVIEVDGPTHFFAQTTLHTGKTRFIRRILERAGYKVYSIPVSKFQAMDDEEQVNLLKSLVAVILNS